MMSAITDPAPDVRQPACYGIGVFAEFGGEQYTAACTSCLEKLFAVINHVDSRKEENAVATENAVSAIGKICHFMGERFDVAPILSAWLTVLPIVIDDQEAPHTYGYLLELLER